MKKIILHIILVFLSFSSFSTILTVSNDVNIPAQYTTFNAAYTAAVAGDTLYVHGSSTNYIVSVPSNTLNKALTIIGPGFNPDKQYKLQATFSSGFNLGVSNISLIGLNDIIGIGINAGITNCKISRCYIFNMVMQPTNTNILIEGCCFRNGGALFLYGTSNTVINCILNGIGFNVGTKNCTIDHNTFFTGGVDFTQLSNSWVSNNIFQSPILVAATNISFNNNMTSGIVLPTAGNVGAGNFVGIAVFVDYSAPRPFYYYSNLNLTGASPGNNAATDGTDVGACGGGNPYASEGEVKTLPIIREMDIMTPIVPSPGNINVHIRATQPN